MAKVLLVLYPDPVTGYPPVYARDSIPVLHGYPGGQTLPTPSAIDFTPGQLLGCVDRAVHLRGGRRFRADLYGGARRDRATSAYEYLGGCGFDRRPPGT